ncbi:MAG: hypothetical protein ACFBSG_05715 [Leptolyngbyaceae cyanobacterium]
MIFDILSGFRFFGFCFVVDNADHCGDEQDVAHYVDDIHINLIIHGLVMTPIEWLYSSFYYLC